VLRSNQRRLSFLGCAAELDQEVAGQVFGFDLAAFLSPEADESGFVATHYDPCVRAADKVPHRHHVVPQPAYVSIPSEADRHPPLQKNTNRFSSAKTGLW
jgi:hypothetical protein